jgi:hypothetical protein
VFWYTDPTPSLVVAQYSLFDYWTSPDGGHLIYSTEFQTVDDPSGALLDFTPIDSVSSVTLPAPKYPSLGDVQVPAGYVLSPDLSDPSDVFPTLELGTSDPFYQFQMRYIYHMQPDDSTKQFDKKLHYLGTPNLGVMDENKRIIFLAVSLHYLTGTAHGGQGVAAFFDKAFREFGLE